MPLSTEYLTINSVVLSLDGAWEVVDPTPLLAEGPAVGDNRDVPGVAGVAYRAKKRGPLRVVLELDIWGEKDETGTAHSDYRVGMRDNIAYLRAQLLSANVGEVTCVYTFPDSSTRTGDCEVLDLQVSTKSPIGNWTTGALEVVLTDGELT